MEAKHCSKCGKDLPDEAVFCPYCMTKLIDVKTGNEVKLKRVKPIMAISVIILSVFIIAGIIIYSHFIQPNISKNDDLQATYDSDTRELDYSKYIGIWCDKDETSDKIINSGGNILEIVTIENDVICFNFKKVSSPDDYKIARLDNVTCGIVDGVGTFFFDDDGLKNSGKGKIKFNDDEIYLDITLTKKNENTSWDVSGNFYLSKEKSSIIDFESYNCIGQYFDSVRFSFGEQIAETFHYNEFDVYAYNDLTVNVFSSTNKVAKITVDYYPLNARTNICYGSINGNSTYDDVYAKLGEPTYNNLTDGYVFYETDEITLQFYFDDNMFITGFDIISNEIN